MEIHGVQKLAFAPMRKHWKIDFVKLDPQVFLIILVPTLERGNELLIWGPNSFLERIQLIRGPLRFRSRKLPGSPGSVALSDT